MERTKLLEQLESVDAGLNTKLVPVFACFCFDGQNVITYDNQVACWRKFETSVKIGGVSGKLLLDFLSASKANAVEITADTETHFKCGRSKISLPRIPRADFIFKVPEIKEASNIRYEGDLSEAIRKAYVSIGEDQAHLWRFGMTVKMQDDLGKVYTTDNESATEADFAAKNLQGEIAIPPRFCELVISDPPRAIQISSRSCIAKYHEDRYLFTRLIGDHDRNYKAYAKLFKDFDEFKFHKIPKALTRALTRANLIAKTTKEPQTVSEMVDGKMTMLTISDNGTRISDSVPTECGNSFNIRFNPSVLLRCLEDCTLMSVTSNSILLKGSGLKRIVSLIER